MESLNNWDRRENRPKLAVGTKWVLRHNKRFIVKITEYTGNLVRYSAMRGKRNRIQSVYGFLQVYKPVMLLFFIWPFTHTESGIVHLPQSGQVSVGFKKPFRKPPVCTFDQPRVRFRAISREWVEIIGPAGTRVAWTCK